MRSLWLSLLLVACAGSAGAEIDLLPADAVVLPESAADMALRQCSRAVPPAGEGYWRPGAEEIARLEAALPAALAAERQPADWSGFPRGWRRQYIGLVRGGRRFVYGNFYPLEVDRHTGNPDRWRSEPVLVCDGGPVFFGVEYDPEANRVTHLAFNGIA